MPSKYMFPKRAGERHAKSGKAPAAPEADWLEHNFMPKRTRVINKERKEYYGGYDRVQADQRRARNARNKDK